MILPATALRVKLSREGFRVKKTRSMLFNNPDGGLPWGRSRWSVYKDDREVASYVRYTPFGPLRLTVHTYDEQTGRRIRETAGNYAKSDADVFGL